MQKEKNEKVPTTSILELIIVILKDLMEEGEGNGKEKERYLTIYYVCVYYKHISTQVVHYKEYPLEQIEKKIQFLNI